MVQYVDAVPAPNQKVWALDAAYDLGGPAANAAATAAALDVRARLITMIGQEPLGRLLAGQVAGTGVELVDLAGPGFSPPLSTVLVERGSGNRAVVSVNARWAGQPELPTAKVFDGVHAALFDGHLMGPGLEFAAACADLEIPLVFDGGSWKPGTPATLSMTTLALVSADFVVPDLGPEAPPHQVLGWLRDAGADWAGVTQGEGPVVVSLADGQVIELPVAPVPPAQMVDSLGAGDVIHGAVVASLAKARAAGAELDDEVVVGAIGHGIEVARRSLLYQGARGWTRVQPSG
jgi:sugar/nucleoside kinase (ribokinase family)